MLDTKVKWLRSDIKYLKRQNEGMVVNELVLMQWRRAAVATESVSRGHSMLIETAFFWVKIEFNLNRTYGPHICDSFV